MHISRKKKIEGKITPDKAARLKECAKQAGMFDYGSCDEALSEYSTSKFNKKCGRCDILGV